MPIFQSSILPTPAVLKAVSDLAHWLVDNIASPYSVNRLTGYLKSLGHNAPKSAVSDYLAWFEDAYFFFSVRVFDASLARSHSNPKKAYCVDHAVIPSLASGVLVNARRYSGAFCRSTGFIEPGLPWT